MIGRLTGQLAAKQPPTVLIDVGGVGYEVEVSMTTLAALPEQGAKVSLHTHLVVREDAHVLFGFGTLAERALFRDLIKVNGVGAKLALLILSGMSVDMFTRCVQEGDTTALTRLPGIGKKTAERLLIEMRDRIGKLDLSAPFNPATGAGQATGSAVDDAAAALVALGYKPADAQRMVNGVKSDGLPSEELIRRALQATVRK